MGDVTKAREKGGGRGRRNGGARNGGLGPLVADVLLTLDAHASL